MTRRLPKRFGSRRIAVSPDVQLRWLKPGRHAFDQLLLELADRFVHEGTVVWDVGASVGGLAFPAAHRSRAFTLAVEAEPFSAGLMRRSARLPENRDLQIEIVCAAAADRDGLIPFAIGGGTRAASGLRDGALPNEHGTSLEVFWSPCFRLDSLLDYFPAPHLLKIDTEGGEEFTLGGAPRMIDEVRPILFIEVYRQFRDSVEERLRSAGYQLFSGESPLGELRPLDWTKDWLAIPSERVDRTRAALAGS